MNSVYEALIEFQCFLLVIALSWLVLSMLGTQEQGVELQSLFIFSGFRDCERFCRLVNLLRSLILQRAKLTKVM